MSTFHQPGFNWCTGISLTKLPLEVRNAAEFEAQKHRLDMPGLLEYFFPIYFWKWCFWSQEATFYAWNFFTKNFGVAPGDACRYVLSIRSMKPSRGSEVDNQQVPHVQIFVSHHFKPPHFSHHFKPLHFPNQIKSPFFTKIAATNLVAVFFFSEKISLALTHPHSNARNSEFWDFRWLETWLLDSALP